MPQNADVCVLALQHDLAVPLIVMVLGDGTVGIGDTSQPLLAMPGEAIDTTTVARTNIFRLQARLADIEVVRPNVMSLQL